MNIFFHGLDRPNLKTIIKDNDLPWEIFSLKTANYKDLTDLIENPELIVFTLFKAKSIKDFQIEKLRKLFPKTKLFCLSNNFCMFLAEDLAHNGIEGFAVLGEVKKEDFLLSVEKVQNGIKSFPSLDTYAIEGLSVKELITIRHIAAGLSNKQIAYLFKVTESSIKKRKEFIMNILSMHTSAEIATWAAVRMNIPKREELIHEGEWLLRFFK